MHTKLVIIIAWAILATIGTLLLDLLIKRNKANKLGVLYTGEYYIESGFVFCSTCNCWWKSEKDGTIIKSCPKKNFFVAPRGQCPECGLLRLYQNHNTEILR
jgi:hypothetical protein